MENKPLSGICILIVEDDPGIINLLQTFFISKGAVVITHENGRGVVQCIEKSNRMS